MCCLFTCCAWVVDLIQRAWVFAMTCFISTAICCVFSISSMSGVALGYNYSLSEYIDAKETNVSVYIKRGVFDDDVSDDMQFRRRAGHEGLQNYVKDDDVKTAPPDDEPLRPGRRLDDTILASDENNRFEGGLMRMTAKPPFPSTIDASLTTTAYEKMRQVQAQYPQGSLDQLKAIQSLINMRKSGSGRETTVQAQVEKKIPYPANDHYLAYVPSLSPEQARRMQLPEPYSPPDASLTGVEVEDESARRVLAGPRQLSPEYLPPDINPARFAVPGAEPQLWPPKDPSLKRRMENAGLPFAKPIRYEKDRPIRPTRITKFTFLTATKEPTSTSKVTRTMSSEDIDRIKDKLIPDRYYPRSGYPKNSNPDYADDTNGFPVRRKRDIRVQTKVASAYTHPNEIVIVPEKNKKHNKYVSAQKSKKHNRDVPEMSQKHNGDVPEMSQGHNRDVPDMSQEYIKDVPELSQERNGDVPELRKVHKGTSPSILVSKLFANNLPGMKNVKRNVYVNDISTTDRFVEIIHSMFS